MHQLITDNKITDHRNRKRNDNRKENLRLANINQNNYNQGISKSNTSGVTGVYICSRKPKNHGTSEYWRAQIRYYGKHISKQFKTKEDAIKWDYKRTRMLGEFAPKNHLFEEYGIKIIFVQYVYIMINICAICLYTIYGKMDIISFINKQIKRGNTYEVHLQ